MVEEKGEEAGDEGNIPKDLLGRLSIRPVAGTFATRARGETCMGPSEHNTGFDAAVIINCGQFGEFVDKFFHMV